MVRFRPPRKKPTTELSLVRVVAKKVKGDKVMKCEMCGYENEKERQPDFFLVADHGAADGSPQTLRVDGKWRKLVEDWLIAYRAVQVVGLLWMRGAHHDAGLGKKMWEAYEFVCRRMEVAGVFNSKYDYRTNWRLPGWSDEILG